MIPAVDLLGGEAVRLERGDFSRVALRAGDPAALAARLAAAGARLVHVVDLEGARRGRLRTGPIGRLVAAARPAAVQASGGIRSPADAEALLAAGAARVVVGTAAFAEPAALRRYASALGEALVVAIDVRAGRVALGGWERETALAAEEAAARCAEAGVARILCTAIERDGTLSGPDVELVSRVREASGLPVLAAGGIASEDDLAALAQAGCEGAIVGRALLDGTLPLSVLAGSASTAWAAGTVPHVGEGSWTFEVEQANCSSCAARVRAALAPLARVDSVEVEHGAETARVRLTPDGELGEDVVNRALAAASAGSGHEYRVKPGSWRHEPAARAG